MTEHVFERARRRTVEREKALNDLWLASVAMVDRPNSHNLAQLERAVNKIKARLSPPHPPPSNPNSPWAKP